MPNIIKDYPLYGYEPYKFTDELGGKWTPINQSETGHIGVMGVISAIKKRQSISNIQTYVAVCQGVALLYLKNNCSMAALSTQPIESGAPNIKALTKAIDYQMKYGSTEEVRKVVVSDEFGCKEINTDPYPKEMDLENLLNRIYMEDKYSKSDEKADTFLLTGYCSGKKDGVAYDAAHAFIIARRDGKWKFFEANRGEVAFDSFENLRAWLQKEAYSGALRELTSLSPVELKPGITRYYTHYTLDAYQSKAGYTYRATHSQSKSLDNNNENYQSITNVHDTLFHKNLTLIAPKSSDPKAEFVAMIDAEIERKKVKPGDFMYDMVLELAVLTAQKNPQFKIFDEETYKNFKAETLGISSDGVMKRP